MPLAISPFFNPVRVPITERNEMIVLGIRSRTVKIGQGRLLCRSMHHHRGVQPNATNHWPSQLVTEEYWLHGFFCSSFFFSSDSERKHYVGRLRWYAILVFVPNEASDTHSSRTKQSLSLLGCNGWATTRQRPQQRPCNVDWRTQENFFFFLLTNHYIYFTLFARPDGLGRRNKYATESLKRCHSFLSRSL